MVLQKIGLERQEIIIITLNKILFAPYRCYVFLYIFQISPETCLLLCLKEFCSLSTIDWRFNILWLERAWKKKKKKKKKQWKSFLSFFTQMISILFALSMLLCVSCFMLQRLGLDFVSRYIAHYRCLVIIITLEHLWAL